MSGRCRPVASAKPAMAPVSSRMAESWGVKTVPLVPSETTTSPGLRVSPRAAPMLSPVPAATSRPPSVRPAAADGASTCRHVELTPERRLEQVEAVVVGPRRPVARAGGVAAVSGPSLETVALLEDPAGQPVVGEHDPGRPGRQLGLVLGKPAQLGHGEAGDRDEAHRVDPGGRATELVGQVGGGPGTAGVVPEQGVAHHGVVLVERHHAVLLAADGDGRHPVEDAVTARLLEGPPPVLGVDLGAVGVGCPRGAHDRARRGVAHDDLGRLGRAVDSGHEGAVAHQWSSSGASASSGRAYALRTRDGRGAPAPS